MKSLVRTAAAACAVAVSLIAPVVLAEPEPLATTAPTFEVEAGASADQLTNDRGTWNENYLLANFKTASGESIYARIARDDRFSMSDHVYEVGTYLPTGPAGAPPRGTFNFAAGFSPEHNVLPSDFFNVGYDLRAGGGFGYQAGYDVRNYTGVNVQVGAAGFDKYWGNQRAAYGMTFAHLSDTPGVAIAQNLRWSDFAGHDVLSISATAGRDVENTGTTIAVYKNIGLDADDLHWFPHGLGLHAGLGYDNLIGAYGRFEVRLGLRKRI